MTHVRVNWKKYAALAGTVVLAGAVQAGYVPQAVADFITSLFGG
jgi:hypothetical protein